MCIAAATLSLDATPAAAQFSPITNRRYTIDLYRGASLGSFRIISIGGAQVAAAEGSAGAVANPATASLRTATSSGEWDWDWHLDWITPTRGTDIDNNGAAEDQNISTFPLISGGLLYQRRRWGIGLTANTRTVKLGGAQGDLEAQSTSGGPYAGMNLLRGQLLLGIALNLTTFEVGAGGSLFTYSNPSLRTGVIVRPRGQNFRIGLSTETARAGDTVDEGCAPEDCEGYILPEAAKRPWEVTLGGAMRFAATDWSESVMSRWRDERYVLVAADLVVSGSVPRGAGIQAFGDMELQPSGRDTNVSVRLGAEVEIIPGWLRLAAGTYYEPARFLDPSGREIAGRMHGTGGIEARLFGFRLFGNQYRARLAISADIAKDYVNLAVSPGLWH